MARHNRDGYGADQRGYAYGVSYQPDWLRHVKVTRVLQTGRQSTKTLFRNPADRQEASPGSGSAPGSPLRIRGSTSRSRLPTSGAPCPGFGLPIW